MNKNLKKIISFAMLVGIFLPLGFVMAKTVTYTPPVTTDVNGFIGKIIRAIVGVVGSFSLIMMIYGGFVWMSATGNVEQVTKGKNILIWSTLGLIVIFASYTIVNFLFTNIG